MSNRNTAIAMILAGFFCCLRFWPVLNLEFDDGHESMLDGRYYAGIQRGWLDSGSLAQTGKPSLTPLPTDPVTGRTYANHPPLAFYVLRGFVQCLGYRESTFRLMGLAFTLMSLLILTHVCGRRLGLWGAGGAVCMFLSLPVTLHHGMSASYAPLVLLFGLVAHLNFPQRRSRLSILVSFFFLYACAWVDWAAAYYLPGLLLLTACTKPREWRTLAFLSSAVLLGFASYFLLLAHWEGSFQEALDALTSASGNRFMMEAYLHPKFLPGMKDNLVAILTWPGLVILSLGLMASTWAMIKRQATSLDNLILVFFLAGFTKVLAFPVEAYHHDFWPYSLVVSTTLAGAQLARFLAQKNRLLALAFVLGTVIFGNLKTFERIDSEYRGRAAGVARALNAEFGRETLLVIAGDITPMTFYLEAWPIDNVHSTSRVRDLFNRWSIGEFPQSRFALIAPKSFDQAMHESDEWTPPKNTKRMVAGDQVITWVDRP